MNSVAFRISGRFLGGQDQCHVSQNGGVGEATIAVPVKCNATTKVIQNVKILSITWVLQKSKLGTEYRNLDDVID